MLRPTIFCGNNALENVFKFAYLGTIFAADGQQIYDIRVRMGMVMTRCGRLGHMFDSPDLGPWLKIRLYVAAVVSLLTYGCESWNLTKDTMRKLNGCNSQMLARITGRNVREEARSTTSSFDIVKNIRVRRLRWLGQILRGDQDRLKIVPGDEISIRNAERQEYVHGCPTPRKSRGSHCPSQRQGLLEITGDEYPFTPKRTNPVYRHIDLYTTDVFILFIY